MQKRADKRKFHYIYKITRIHDGKFYIGMHSTDVLEDGYFGSGKRITRSIKKYGKDMHQKEILEYLTDRATLKAREAQIVNQELLEDENCMNLKLGGEGGGFISAEHKHAFHSSGGRVSGKKNWKNVLPIFVDPVKKKKLFDEMVKTRSKNNSFATMTGRQHTQETKCKMSLSQMSEKNSQFGTCWVTDGVKPVKIKKEQLNEYLEKGYSRGRK